MSTESTTTETWKRLGRLLAERRVQINPEYRNRLKFAANVGLNERLVSDLECGRRTSYRDTSLQAVESAYHLRPGNITRLLEGGELEPLEPVARVANETDASVAPFTCEYCKRAPASALLVFDMVLNGHTQRIKNLVCADCAPRSGEDVRWSSLIKTAYVMPLGEARREK